MHLVGILFPQLSSNFNFVQFGKLNPAEARISEVRDTLPPVDKCSDNVRHSKRSSRGKLIRVVTEVNGARGGVAV